MQAHMIFYFKTWRSRKKDRSRTQRCQKTFDGGWRREIIEISEALERIGIRFDIILTSPLKRAYQTADIAKEFKAQKKMQKLQELSPEGNRFALSEIIIV